MPRSIQNVRSVVAVLSRQYKNKAYLLAPRSVVVRPCDNSKMMLKIAVERSYHGGVTADGTLHGFYSRMMQNHLGNGERETLVL